jgi:hypothetical protein
MNPNNNSDAQDHPLSVPVAPRQSFWQKLGGASLTIAVLFHAILLLIGAFGIFQVIQEPVKKVDFMPAGGGGGERGAEHKVQQKKRAQITPTTNVKRVFAEGATASYAIPEQGDNFGEMSALSSLSGGGMSGGLGGSGTGNGFGKGDGKGGGLGMGGGKLNPFGMIDPNGNALEGTFYNLNFKAKGEATATDNSKQYEIINDFVTVAGKNLNSKNTRKQSKSCIRRRSTCPRWTRAKPPALSASRPIPIHGGLLSTAALLRRRRPENSVLSARGMTRWSYDSTVGTYSTSVISRERSPEKYDRSCQARKDFRQLSASARWNLP